MTIIKQEFTPPFVGIVFLASLMIVIIGHLTKMDFGIIGTIAWIVVIGGFIYFIFWIISKIFG